MKEKNILSKVTVIMVSACLCFTGSAFADSEAEETTVVQKNTVKTLGEKNEDAVQVELTNKTEKKIEYIRLEKFDNDYDKNGNIIALQNALIDQKYLDDVADGSYGPNTQAAVADFRIANDLSEDGGIDDEMMALLLGDDYQGNLLKDGNVIAADETVSLYVEIDDENADDSEEESEDAAELRKALGDYSLSTEFIVTVKFVDDDAEYTIRAFNVDGTEAVALYLKDDILYVEYTGNGEESVNTYDFEKYMNGYYYPAETDDSNYSDYSSYDDYSYDYADDYSYDYSEDYSDDTGAAQGADGCIEDGLFY